MIFLPKYKYPDKIKKLNSLLLSSIKNGPNHESVAPKKK